MKNKNIDEFQLPKLTFSIQTHCFELRIKKTIVITTQGIPEQHVFTLQ